MLPWRQYAEASGAKSNLNAVTKLSHRMRGFYELLGPGALIHKGVRRGDRALQGPYAQRKTLAEGLREAAKRVAPNGFWGPKP
jgi:hypothetical protein